MKHISILVLQDAIMSSIDAPRQLFSRVNEFLEAKGREPVFQVNLVGLTKEVLNGVYSIHCDQTLDEAGTTDIIIVPMICNGLARVVLANKDFIPWVITQYKNGSEIACLCSGTFFLASTGLLNGKDCAVHWAAADDFKKMYPAVHVVNDKLIMHQQGIYTSGGFYSYLNLILCLIEKYAGREMAVYVSKMFEIEIERKSQAPYTIFIGQKDHDDEPVKKAQEYIENNFEDKITVEGLSNMLSLSRRNFERRFKKATSNTIIEYTQRVKIEVVKKGLETTHKTIADLMYDVGYSDIKAFRTIFKKLTGLGPQEYRNKYSVSLLAS
ncbi:MAG TPA: helix-turn-helix domain-containing protein [Puia sp.]|nr:helix-turn-helix domain-containing protein [Puia sp.]